MYKRVGCRGFNVKFIIAWKALIWNEFLISKRLVVSLLGGIEDIQFWFSLFKETYHRILDCSFVRALISVNSFTVISWNCRRLNWNFRPHFTLFCRKKRNSQCALEFNFFVEKEWYIIYLSFIKKLFCIWQ